jgi:hypothetical protein
VAFKPGPWLSPWDAADLASTGPWGDGVFGGINPGDVAYGAPLTQLASEHAFLGDLLEAAAVAGHSSSVVDGVAMTVRAFHALLLAESREYEQRGVVGDALGWLDADHYRDLVILLEQLAADLEERAAELSEKTISDLEPQYRQREQVWAAGCLARAKRSRARAEKVRRDNRAGRLHYQ